MRGSYVIYTALTMTVLAGAGRVLSQVPSAKLQAAPPVRLGGGIRLGAADNLASLTDLGGKMFGAGRNRVVQLDEDGKVAKSFRTTAARPSVSPYGTESLVLADLRTQKIFILRTDDGSIKPLLDLKEVRDPSDDQGVFPNLHMARDGQFQSVASDGKSVYVAFSAGFSSAILKIDPATRQVVGRAFASAADPDAMTFFDGSLFVLVGNGSQVRRFTPELEKTQDVIDLPLQSAKGLGIRAGELRLLDGPTKVVRVSIDPRSVGRASLRQNLDLVRIVNRQIARVPFPKFNLISRYAVLVTGDLAENFSGECFWNDTYWMYQTLIANGYKPENIFVLYGDGADFASLNPYYQAATPVTDFAATAANVKMVFDGLKNGDAAHAIPKIDDNDTLFVWTFDHGGSSGGGSYLCLRGSTIGANDFNTRLNALPYARRAVFMQQCYSGGFIAGLQNDRTYVSTACQSNEVAHPADTENETVGGRSYSHGEFDYYITTALNRLRTSPPGGSVNADSNSDSYVSSLEMHTWMASHESQPETPASGDLGGIGALFRFKK